MDFVKVLMYEGDISGSSYYWNLVLLVSEDSL